MTPKTQLLLFLVANPKPANPVRIMKGLFLFSQAVGEKKLPATETFEFEPMDYGPCSLDVYKELDVLIKEGLARIEPVPGETWKRYCITEAGLKCAQQNQNPEEKPLAEFLHKIRDWCDAQTFTTLLQAVYRAYPDFAVNSVLPHLRPNQ
jgi:hypothetical protein